MDLLFILIIPVLIGLGGLIFGGGKVTLKELLVQEAVLVVLISIVFFASAGLKMMDTEIWNGVITEKEKVTTSCCHSYSCNCRQVCSGSGDSRSCYTHCDTCYRHSNDVRWGATTSNGETAYYNGCNSPRTKEPRRFTEIIIGEPTSIEHKYKNYIKGSPDTILKRVVSDKEFDIPEYPQVYDHYRVSRFLTVGYDMPDPISFYGLDQQLDKINADLGARKKINITVLVVNESDQLYFEKLNEVWLGGKKNDFVVVIGVPEYPKITWANVMSWSDSEDAKVFVKNRIMDLGQFDGEEILKIIREEVESKYVKKSMEDFDYLKYRIEPSFKTKIVITIIGTIISIILTIYARRED